MSNEYGRIRPPYGGVRICMNATCEQELSEVEGAYMHSNLDTGKLVVFCGSCSRLAELHAPYRLPLVML